jgi:hypothetical protein
MAFEPSGKALVIQDTVLQYKDITGKAPGSLGAKAKPDELKSRLERLQREVEELRREIERPRPSNAPSGK